MSPVEQILRLLENLNTQESEIVARAVSEHLEDLDDVAAFDASEADQEPMESLDSVLARYAIKRAA